MSEQSKKCGKCGKEKELSCFCKSKTGKFGVSSQCRECRKEYDNENRDKFIPYHTAKRERELETFQKYDKKYKSENKDKINYHDRERWKNDLPYRMRKILRTRLHSTLRYGKKFTSTLNLLSCSIDEFKQKIEIQFLPEMNWDNWGPVWELDHILPCASFNLMDGEEQRRCFHYSNYQPLFKTTEIALSFGYVDYLGNREKKDKIL